ncbi:3-oxoacyl-ACP reductase, partial [Klebsiella pneumoniae]|nr:3-oxoacyl-ACP reductase [Klebsiella pneumoniae]
MHWRRLPPDLGPDYSEDLLSAARDIMKSDQHNTILIVGASRGLGHAMAATFLQHGWEVIGT